MRIMAFLLFLIPPVLSSAATTYAITSGTADLTVQSGGSTSESFSFAGSGFSFTGSGGLSANPCTATCALGDPISSALAELSSDDSGVSGTITFGSTSTNYFEGPASQGSVDIFYNFNLSTPATNPPTHLTLTGPFTASAFFQDSNIAPDTLSFNGSGTVTINLSLASQAYEFESMHFAFTSVPEPSPGLMVFAGIVVLAILRFVWRQTGVLGRKRDLIRSNVAAIYSSSS